MLEMWKEAVMEEYFVYLIYVATYKQFTMTTVTAT
jgi:hypothetical protein